MKSPLRYPGGKSKAINVLHDILFKCFKQHEYIISPFCGGCSFEFSLCNVKHMILCDKFKPLIIFWNIVKHQRDELIEALKIELEFEMTKESFNMFRDELKNMLNEYKTSDCETSDLYIAIDFFILNRCSFSGTTLCGGFSKDAAQNRFTLSSINNISKLELSNIEFIEQDFTETLTNIQENYFIFCDPPYYISNPNLYGNNGDLHSNFDHELFHDYITKCKNDYMICYNDCEYIRDLYKDNLILEAKWFHSINKNTNSSEKRSFERSEIIILSKTRLNQ